MLGARVPTVKSSANRNSALGPLAVGAGEPGDQSRRLARTRKHACSRRLPDQVPQEEVLVALGPRLGRKIDVAVPVHIGRLHFVHRPLPKHVLTPAI
jgi:hypothetical protein